MSVTFQTILVGDNGTPEAERAVAVALSLGEKLNAKVILLGVLAPPSAESLAEGYGLTNSMEARNNLQAHLERRAEAGRHSGINVVTEIVEGMPDHAIEKRADNGGADLVVVGHRDVGRVRIWLEGSTSESLVRRCPVSVLVVHDEV